jgi:hypothetical protein
MSVSAGTSRVSGAIPPVAPEQQDSGVQVSQTQRVNPDQVGVLPNLVNRLALTGDTLDQQRTEFTDLIRRRGRYFSHTPNALDSYANYTYHIRWSLTDDIVGSTITSGDQFQRTPKVIIAESGVTAGFNIVEFEIENLCAPGPRIQAMLHTSFKMRIKEPYGFSLVDRIYSISQQMGVKNHLTNSTFLEIWFTGYNEDGSIATTDLKQEFYKLFRVNITKLESDTKSEGTTYDIEGIVDNSYANSDHIAVFAQGVTINEVGNVGDFFDKLADALNRQQLDLQFDNTRRVEYAFNVPREMRSWPFSRSPYTSQRNSDIRVLNPSNLSNPSISIARGMDVSTILFFVVSMTDKGREFVAGEERPPTPSGSGVQNGRSQASISANGMANILVVHSRSQLIGFDYITNDYVRKITYTFSQYPTSRAMIDQTNVRASLQEAQQQDRAATLSRSGRYLKAYEYIFTGRNLDILKMDIKLEWFWQATIPTQLGENTYSNATAPPQLDQNGVAVNIINRYRMARNASVRAQQAITRANATLAENSGASQTERAAATTQLAEAQRNLVDAQTELANFTNDARQFQVIWGDRSSGDQALQNIRVGDQRLLQDPAITRNLQQRLNWSQVVANRRDLYLEDAQVVEVNQQALPISFRTNPGPVNQITNVGADPAPERVSAQQSPGNMPRNRSLVGAVLNDVMASHYFAEVEIEIRGDPYWIGLGNVAETAILSSENPAIEYSNNGAWFYGGETGFLLTFRTGEPPDEYTGYVNFTSSSIAFTGLYNVHTIRSMFKDGKFTQTVKALRDNLLMSSTVTNQQQPQSTSGAPQATTTASMTGANGTTIAATTQGLDTPDR